MAYTQKDIEKKSLIQLSTILNVKQVSRREKCFHANGPARRCFCH